MDFFKLILLPFAWFTVALASLGNILGMKIPELKL